MSRATSKRRSKDLATTDATRLAPVAGNTSKSSSTDAVAANAAFPARAANAIPVAMALACYLGAVLLIAPWGDYPINDDWQYAWVAKCFAETGQLRIDMRVAPSLVLQTLAAWPLIKLVGFSHLALRLFTVALGGALIALVDALLRTFKVQPVTRAGALLLWVFNPIMLSLACSFMTEIYGYLFALGGCLVWLRSRAKASNAESLSWSAAVLAGALTGAAFWTRQLCALVFAPLWFTTLVLLLWRRRQDATIRMPWGPLAAAAAVHGAVIAAYFPWARANNAFHEQFSQPLANLTNAGHIDWQSAGLTTYGMLLYAGFFALPLLCSPTAWRQAWRNKYLVVGLGLLEWAGYVGCTTYGTPWPVLANFHQQFPVLTNIITDFGISAFTLGDRWVTNAVRPASLTGFWGAIYVVLLIACPVAFAQALRRAAAAIRQPSSPLMQEGMVFGLFLAVGALGIVTLTFRAAVFDRYLLTPLFGLWLMTALAATDVSAWRGRLAQGAAAVALVPLAFYAIAALHDYFRWNDARWQLYQRAQSLGAGVLDVEGGYELNGWLLASTHAVPDRANTGYFPGPRLFTVTLTEIPGTQTVAAQNVDTWMMRMPPLLLRQRR